MRRLVTLALAAMLAIFYGYAQQPTQAYIFKSLLSGGNVGGFTLPRDAAIDGSALNDTGEAAIVIHYSEGGREHTAVLTPKRLVAKDGDTIDGKIITRVIGTSLSINAANRVAFEVLFGDPGQTGIFVERKFIVALSQAGSQDDFLLNDDGKVVLRAAVAVPQVQTPAPAQTAPGWQKSIGLTIPNAVARRIYGPNSPVSGVNPNILTQPTAPQKPPQKQSPQFQSKPVTPPRPCAIPEWPYPPSWRLGDDMIGPIASHTFDPAKGKTYESRFFGSMGTPVRVIQCSSDGKPLMIVIGDDHHGEFEIWTPMGLLAHTRTGGFLNLQGISGNIPARDVVKADSPLRINRIGEILMPVVLDPEGSALLLATPKR